MTNHPTVKVYTASKLEHAPIWRQLSEHPNWEFVEFTARWPFEHVGKIPDTEAFARIFWEHDVADVRRADAVLVYGEPEDVLRGALVEAGVGLAIGRDIVTVGFSPSFGTWHYHPGVFRTATLDEARALLEFLANSGRYNGLGAAHAR